MTNKSAPVEADDNVTWARLFADVPAACAAAKTYPAKMRAIADELERSRAEIAAIKAAAEDSTEYVLAQVNRELRAEIARLQERNRLIEDTQHINDVLLSVQLAAATEQIAKLEALVDEVLDGHLAPADGGWLARAKALRSAVKP